MAASYPGAVKTFSAVVNGVTKLVAALFNSPYDEITAIETELGTDVAGSLSDLKTRLAVALNDNGTLKITSATIIQIGTITSGDGEETITFAASFANTTYTIIVCFRDSDGTGGNHIVRAKSAGSCTIYGDNCGGADSGFAEYIAIGTAA